MAQEQKACTVVQAMGVAKRGLEQIRLTVVGEVSEVSDKPGYKAAYFTIRDDEASMPCVMWRDAYLASGVQLRPGMLVQVTGSFTLYAAKGRMQFQVRKLEMAGEGDLRMRVAQLAAKLEAEGLMEQSRKRRSPALPRRIAVVTSPRGKAVRDCLRTLRRRYPLGEVLVFGVPVEGEGAPAAMCEALAAAQQTVPAPDVILLVRGGGSYEDLMPFNDERLARAIVACTIPVVTGIGHEPDNSIADMVADVRCSTPTGAAEAVAPSMDELHNKIKNATNALGGAYKSRLAGASHSLARLADRPLWQDPRYLTAERAQTLDMMEELLGRALPGLVSGYGSQLDLLGTRLRSAIPDAMTGQRHELDMLQQRLAAALPGAVTAARRETAELQDRLGSAAADVVREQVRQVALSAAKLDALSPLKTLARGYSITFQEDGRSVIDSVEAVHQGQDITVRLKDGNVDCSVTGVRKAEAQ